MSHLESRDGAGAIARGELALLAIGPPAKHVQVDRFSAGGDFGQRLSSGRIVNIKLLNLLGPFPPAANSREPASKTLQEKL